MGTYDFVSATGTVTNGSIVQAWSGGSVVANAYVLQAFYSNTTAGQLTLFPLSGKIAANTLYTIGNTITVHSGANGYVDSSSIGYSVGTANLVLTLDSQVGSFQLGEQIVQSNPNFPTDGSIQAQSDLISVSNGFVTMSSHQGVFIPGQILGTTSGATANVTAMAVTIGIKTTSTGSQWTSALGNWIYGSNMTANVTFVSSAITSSFGISGLSQTETILVNTDSLSAIANAPLLGPYGLAANSSANSSTPFPSMLSYANLVVGQISNVFTLTPVRRPDDIRQRAATAQPNDERCRQ